MKEKSRDALRFSIFLESPKSISLLFHSFFCAFQTNEWNNKEHLFIIPFIRLEGTEEFPSVAPGIHEAWNYERKIAAFFGLKPVGHPDSRRLMLHENWPDNLYPLRKDFPWNSRPAHANGKGYAFEKIEGEGVYEIPVGPIHAGIIEPGHFRFNVAGGENLFV